MRLLKHRRYLLIALVLIGIGGVAVAYVRSPGYRAAQAFAKVQEGMTDEEAKSVMRQYGGEIMAGGSTGQWIKQPVDFDHGYWFGDRCYVFVVFPIESPNGEPLRVKGKRLSRPTFSEWLSRCLQSIKSRMASYSSDSNERMQEMLNESEDLRATSGEWKRFWEIEQPMHFAEPKK